uniref:Uncharacterized protein n=1 Tax=Cannabis sativa TaxID=3483 RepID=A0A803Q2T6_CANSA
MLIMLTIGATYAPPTPPNSSIQSPPTPLQQVDEIKPSKEAPMPKPPLPIYVPVPPFPSRLRKTKKDEIDKDIHETFCKVEVNLPLLDVIRQVPRYEIF